MLEVEMKFPVADFGPIRARLADWSATKAEERHDEDQYFNAPDRDFARTDEALRLRRVGSANLLTYKGPKIDARTKTQSEIELALADGDETANKTKHLLQNLGYRPTADAVKRRTAYHLHW